MPSASALPRRTERGQGATGVVPGRGRGRAAAEAGGAMNRARTIVGGRGVGGNAEWEKEGGADTGGAMNRARTIM